MWRAINATATGHDRPAIAFYLSAKGRFPMWFAASIIVNTMLMAGFLLVMLGLARVAYGTEE
jgi:hypothetical protein